MSTGDESGRQAHAGDPGVRPLALEEAAADKPPTPERRASARPPAIAAGRAPAASRDGRGSGTLPAAEGGPRQTTRMTTEEISALVGNGPSTGDEFDAEKTIVMAERHLLDEPSSFDDAPTVEGDLRHRPIVDVRAAARPLPALDAVPEPQPSDAGRRRTSRRTVRIPDDPVERQEKLVDRLHFGDEVSSDDVTMVRPLRIIDIGSDPPPAIRSAEASWPPRSLALADSGEHTSEPAHAIGPHAVVPQAMAPHAVAPAHVPHEPLPVARFDLDPMVHTPRMDPLPRIEAYEVGWTPAMPPVVPIEDRPSAETELGQGDFEEIPESPPASLNTPKKPPPPPKRDSTRAEAKAEAPRTPPPVDDMKSTAVDPGVIKRPRAWFEELFGEDYLRTMDRLAPRELAREVDFVEESLSVEKHAVILDLACGRGEIACGLASRGYTVVGVDLSPSALAECQATAREARVAPSFVRADMRELDFEEAFDAAVFWHTSFGYFDDAENLAVLRRLHRALRQGGMLLLDVANRDYVAPRSPSLVWFEGDGCVCMDDMSVDFLTSRMRVKRTAMFDDGHSRELEYSIRLYSLSELGRALHDSGFKVVEVTGHLAHPGTFFGTESPRLIVLAERN